MMATPTLLDKRGFEGGADVAKLPEAEQRAFVGRGPAPRDRA